MKLRYLLLFTTAIGACSALLLGADMYRRMQDAEGLITLNNLPLRQDSVLVFGMPHTIGLISLAFLFLASFLLLITALRDPAFLASIEQQKIKAKQAPAVAPPPALPLITIIPIAEAAAQVPDTAPVEAAPVAVPPEIQAETSEVQTAPPAAPACVEAPRAEPILAFEVPVPATQALPAESETKPAPSSNPQSAVRPDANT